MTDEQIREIEQIILQLHATEIVLQRQVTETEGEIERIRNIRAALEEQLPNENRFEHLFD